ncbi:superinfection immunity protein [Luteolibacter flavescens]|uniref:Superinfection immunity protein n=1 Tax=Luteolibacter flavescens TaxID=1859460 RepID=A0ABT3FRU1_9BACT|nr:superinfection immunity protein [Luteolibacter flavescens]MCW1886280.1 superinfection immunity protein [Luteolibacter flavescens]
MENLETLRAKFMDSKPAPIPEEAYEPRHARRRRTLGEEHALPLWGRWVIGLALAVVASAVGFYYFGEEAIVRSMPAVLQWLGFVVVILAGIVVYFLPAVVAWNYQVRRSGAILALNFLVGWTFFGWVGAFVWAIAEVESQEPLTSAPQP